MKITPLGKVALDTAVQLSTIAGVPGYSNKVTLQPLAANTGKLYVGIGAAPNISTLANVFKILTAGDDWGIGDERDGDLIDNSKIWIVSDATGDFSLGATYER